MKIRRVAPHLAFLRSLPSKLAIREAIERAHAAGFPEVKMHHVEYARSSKRKAQQQLQRRSQNGRNEAKYAAPVVALRRAAPDDADTLALCEQYRRMTARLGTDRAQRIVDDVAASVLAIDERTAS